LPRAHANAGIDLARGDTSEMVLGPTRFKTDMMSHDSVWNRFLARGNLAIAAR
jgi:hypothetical protein